MVTIFKVCLEMIRVIKNYTSTPLIRVGIIARMTLRKASKFSAVAFQAGLVAYSADP